jgi:hypothetical protein
VHILGRGPVDAAQPTPGVLSASVAFTEPGQSALLLRQRHVADLDRVWTTDLYFGVVRNADAIAEQAVSAKGPPHCGRSLRRRQSVKLAAPESLNPVWAVHSRALPARIKAEPT